VRARSLLGFGLPVLVAASLCAPAAAATADNEIVERGRYLATAAGCATCHTDEENDGLPYAGGRRFDTPIGVLVAPNISPDPEHGIGNWTDDEFVTALRTGVGPGGKYYYPAFPYASYAGMTRDDALAIKAFLDTVEPVTQPSPEHEIEWYAPGRWSMRLWQSQFSPYEYPPSGNNDSQPWQRGAYLVRHVAHCGECHTPRNQLGALKLARQHAGSPKDAPGGGAPDIRAIDSGIGAWAVEDLLLFFQIGMMLDGDFAGASMAPVIDNLAELTEADQRAIATYLLSIE